MSEPIRALPSSMREEMSWRASVKVPAISRARSTSVSLIWRAR
jgi:hypothetical protein